MVKKIHHTFKYKKPGHGIFNNNFRGSISFKIKINNQEYGTYDYFDTNNYFSRMRTLVMEKHRLVEALIETKEIK